MAGLTLLTLALTAPPVAAQTGDASWNPQASERLVRLPGVDLRRALEQDFRGSTLAAALHGVESEMGFKRQTLTDLRGAVEQADDGAIRLELNHQLLAERKAYIEMKEREITLRGRAATARVNLLERLLRAAQRDRAAEAAGSTGLAAEVAAARARMERATVRVDTDLFHSVAGPQSRYSEHYARNFAAMESLVRAINSHPMYDRAVLDGSAVSKPVLLQQLIAEAEGEAALLKQEREIVGYMAQLVALDTRALLDSVMVAEFDDPAGPLAPQSIADDVDLFLN